MMMMKDHLHSFDEQYHQLKSALDQWHSNLIDQIETMYLNTLIQLDTSYERLKSFRETLDILLDDQRGSKNFSFQLIDLEVFSSSSTQYIGIYEYFISIILDRK